VTGSYEWHQHRTPGIALAGRSGRLTRRDRRHAPRRGPRVRRRVARRV